MTIETMDIKKQPLRVLKKMRKYHRKNRNNPLHADALNSLQNTIATKQEKFLAVTQQVAAARLERLLKMGAKKT